MIPLPERMSTNDVSQWLNDGIVLVKQKDGEHRPAVYESVEGFYDEDGDMESSLAQWVVVRYLSSPSDRARVPLSDVFCHWPRCGAVNMGPVALYVQRTQTRQYRRTFNSRGVTPFVPERQHVPPEMMSPQLSLKLQSFICFAPEVLRPQYIKPEAARCLLATTCFSVAISPTIIITRGRGEYRHVYYNGEFVAKWTGEHLIPLRPRLPRAVKKRLGGVSW